MGRMMKSLCKKQHYYLVQWAAHSTRDFWLVWNFSGFVCGMVHFCLERWGELLLMVSMCGSILVAWSFVNTCFRPKICLFSKKIAKSEHAQVTMLDTSGQTRVTKGYDEPKFVQKILWYCAMLFHFGEYQFSDSGLSSARDTFFTLGSNLLLQSIS